MKEAIFRGMLSGGAMGVIATFMLDMNAPRAFFLGVVAGIAASLTHYYLKKK